MNEAFYAVGSFPKYAIAPNINWWGTVIAFGLVLISVIYCILQAKKEQSVLPLIILIASLTTVVIEPFYDVLGSATHPSAGVTTLVNILGRKMPIYNALIFILYWSGGIVYVISQIRSGITMKNWLTLAAMLIGSSILFEIVPVSFGMWRYYNEQPLQIFGFPIWYAFINTHTVMGLSLAVYLLQKILGSQRAWLIIPMYPGLLFGITIFAALPGFIATSTTNGYAWLLLGTGLSMIMAIVFIWTYGLIICREGALQPEIGATNMS